MIQTYCETRRLLSTELNSNLAEFFESLDTSGDGNTDLFDYLTGLGMLQLSNTVKNNYEEFFKFLDVDESGIVTKKDFHLFFEALKA